MSTYMLHFNDSLNPTYPFWYYGAAGKCHHDRETYAREIGIQKLSGYYYNWEEEPADMLKVRMDGIFAGLKRNDTVIVHWPISFNDRYIQFMIDEIKMFGAKLVYLVDDMSAWRVSGQLDEAGARENLDWFESTTYGLENRYLKQGDGIILHSRPMYERLKRQFEVTGDTLTENVAFYGPSGYRTVYFQDRRKNGQGVDYAGNLDKAPFLKELPSDFKLNVYGGQPQDEELKNHENIRLHPHVDPEAIAQMLKGSFGLIYDSESYPEVTGILGEYEQYNTPAKFPMYLAANEPVILWSKAPMAQFVEKNRIGLIIDDLSQLPEKVAAVTDEQYEDMLNNVERISPLIRNGYYVKKAMIDVIGMVQDWDYHDSTKGGLPERLD